MYVRNLFWKTTNPNYTIPMGFQEIGYEGNVFRRQMLKHIIMLYG